MIEKKEPGTLRAPLFSEQVALIAGLDEATAKRLKRYLEHAHNPVRMPAADPFIRTAGASAAIALVAAAVAAFVPEARAPGLVVAPIAIGLGAWMARMALRAQEQEAALLIEKLAHALSKRNKEGKNG
jgi:hypothetical protein